MGISDGKNPLDATGVHPESYDATKAVLEKLGYHFTGCRFGLFCYAAEETGGLALAAMAMCPPLSFASSEMPVQKYISLRRVDFRIRSLSL